MHDNYTPMCTIYGYDNTSKADWTDILYEITCLGNNFEGCEIK